MAAEHFRIVKDRIIDHFYSAGHTSVDGKETDTDHPLHDLFAETYRLAEKILCFDNLYCQNLEDITRCRREICRRLDDAEEVYATKGTTAAPKDLEVRLKESLPDHAILLAMRFATINKSENVDIINRLARMNALHLWQVPWIQVTGAGIAVVDVGSDTKGISTEKAGSSIGNALAVGLTEVQHQIKDAKNAKEDLEKQLEIVERVEAAALQASDAIMKAQKTLATIQSLNC
ncbi:hypothetical protein A9K55_003256 [Cordyceps militaris]|uniref:Uncharacterized protein n=1 Tax=Cordyceps militaris TaxID=73501 RepID=A0A2H4S7S3_CORMI|nr:hypothetical protein A9K55_003256 [Cordyceps militaris]